MLQALQRQRAEQAAAEAAALKAKACAHARPQNAARSDVGGLTAEFLERCYSHQQRWQQFEKGLVGNMRACGWCGKVAFGGQHSMLWINMRPRQCDEVPPAVAAHPQLLYSVTAGEQPQQRTGLANPNPGQYYCCQTCASAPSREARRSYHVRTSGQYMRAMGTLYKLNAGAAQPGVLVHVAQHDGCRATGVAIATFRPVRCWFDF
jgi:hypothetical protein